MKVSPKQMWTYFPICRLKPEISRSKVKLLIDDVSKDKKEALYSENLMIWDMLLDI